MPRPLALLQLQPMILLHCLCNDSVPRDSAAFLRPEHPAPGRQSAGQVLDPGAKENLWALCPRGPLICRGLRLDLLRGSTRRGVG